MDSVLRDIDRERSKMQSDIDNLHRHYEKLAGFVRQYIEQTTTEWAKLVASHSKTLLLVVETTSIVNEHGSSYGGDEPIRFTTLSLANGEMWSQLLRPTHSRQVRGTEYHGLTLADLEKQPNISEAWPTIAEQLEGRQVIIFGADYAREALQSVNHSYLLDGAYCLHNKCKEFYGEFYDLSLERVLIHQGIEKKRDELRDSRDRLLILAQVVHNLAAGMEKQSQESEDSDSDDLSEHPF